MLREILKIKVKKRFNPRTYARVIKQRKSKYDVSQKVKREEIPACRNEPWLLIP
jgi:hypothetical protein